MVFQYYRELMGYLVDKSKRIALVVRQDGFEEYLKSTKAIFELFWRLSSPKTVLTDY